MSQESSAMLNTEVFHDDFDVDAPITESEESAEKVPSLNHSYVCAQIMRQLMQYEGIQPLPEVTLDIDRGLTPDISIFPKEQIQPDFFSDVLKVAQMPQLAVEIVSSSQNVQSILNKAKLLVEAGVETVWVIEPYSRGIFVLNKQTTSLFHEEVVESGGVRVDFAQVFSP